MELRRTRSTPDTTFTLRRASRLETWRAAPTSASRTASASFGLTIQGKTRLTVGVTFHQFLFYITECQSAGWRPLTRGRVLPIRVRSQDRRPAVLQVISNDWSSEDKVVPGARCFARGTRKPPKKRSDDISELSGQLPQWPSPTEDHPSCEGQHHQHSLHR